MTFGQKHNLFLNIKGTRDKKGFIAYEGKMENIPSKLAGSVENLLFTVFSAIGALLLPDRNLFKKIASGYRNVFYKRTVGIFV